MLIESQMAKKTVLRKRPRKRAEQQRALDTRASILDAAIAEFAERGFEGASIRAIADRLGLQHPLITYHYRSSLSNNPRLKWVAETVLAPLLERLIPQIVAAQKQGLLPAADPILFHYMMVSLTATLSGFGPEMQVTSGLSARDAKVIEAYWRLVDAVVFETQTCGKTARGGEALKRRMRAGSVLQ